MFGVTDDRLLLRSTRPDKVADYNQSSSNAHAGLQGECRISSPPTAWINSSPARTAPQRHVLRLRITEIHKHAVTHVLRDEPTKPLDGLGDALLISGNDQAEVLRVHSRR